MEIELVMRSTFARYALPAMLCVLILMLACPINAQVVDTTSLTNKVICGYQGWHSCVGDGQPSWVGWNHWSKKSDYIGLPDYYDSDIGRTRTTYNIEVWPDVREYNASDVFSCGSGVTLQDGSTGKLFSDYRQGAVNVHFRWMQENGIDGVFHQRFAGGVQIDSNTGQVDPTESWYHRMDVVLQNVMNASTTYGRAWALEYDISGVADSTTLGLSDIYNKLTGDWAYLCNSFDIKNHPRYLHHNGKPVVVIWGMGFNDTGHPCSTATAQAVITWFKNNGCFVIGGVPGYWRSGTNDSRSGWASTYAMFDGITPWTVGRYKNSSEITSWKSRVSSDISLCNSTTEPSGLKQLYMPTAWPRFGWDNMNATAAGSTHIPADNLNYAAGRFFWEQLYNWKNAGATCQFIAMFDEYDEATAIMKSTDNVPTTGCWLKTQGKGEDFYLRLANYASQMQRNASGFSSTFYSTLSSIPDNSQIISNTIPTTMVALQEYDVSVIVKNTGETCWNAELFRLGAVGDSDPFAEGRQNLPSGTTVMPNGQYTFTFRMTAPATPGSYASDWQMVHEIIRWYGGVLSVPITVVSGPDTITPRAVAMFAATPGDAMVNLTWQNSPSPDSTGTMIRCSTTGYPASAADGFLVVDKPGAPGAVDSFIHTGLINGVTYYYSAFAHDAVPNYAAKMDAIAVPFDYDPPAAVTSFTATSTSAQATLSWTNPTDADFVGTMVRYKTTDYPTSPTDGTLLCNKTGAPGSADSCIQTNVISGTTYYYAAFTYDEIPNYGVAATSSVLVPYDTTPPTSTVDKVTGVYKAPLTVTLSTNEPATTYYTVDGNEPSTSSDVYESPMLLSDDMVLRFFAVDTAGNAEQTIHEAVYWIIADSDDLIGDIKTKGSATPGRFADVILYWKSGNIGYIEEPNRSSAIRVESDSLPALGSVCVAGSLVRTSSDCYLAVDAITPSDGPSILKTLGATNVAIKKSLLSGMFVKAFGKVQAGSITSNSFVISDGSDASGIKVMIAPGQVTVTAGQYVAVSGAMGGTLTEPLLYLMTLSNY